VISAARAFGFSRQSAVRFALLLSLPAIGGAVLLTATGLSSLENLALAALVALLSFLVALAVLKGFIQFSQRFSLLGFVVYRLALSAVLFMIILS
jgi:undecaprenyl-diphosphatase